MSNGDRVYVCDWRHPLYRTNGLITNLTRDGKLVVELAVGFSLDFSPHEIELDLRAANVR